MSDIQRIEWNYAGIGELLRSEEMKACVEDVASGVLSACGAGYDMRTHNTGQRWACNVYADTTAANKDNLENNTLLKAAFG